MQLRLLDLAMFVLVPARGKPLKIEAFTMLGKGLAWFFN